MTKSDTLLPPTQKCGEDLVRRESLNALMISIHKLFMVVFLCNEIFTLFYSLLIHK